MVRADFQSPLTTKQATPVQNPSPIAPHDFNMIERAQEQMSPMLSTLCNVQITRAEILPVHPYESPPTDMRLTIKSTTMTPRPALIAPRAVKTPTASPVLPIPRKPPDDGWETTRLAPNQDTRPSPASRIQRQLFQYSPVAENTLRTPNQIITRSERQRCSATPNLAAAADMILWASMRDYYLCSSKWRFEEEQTGMDSGSPLTWTMVHPISKTRTQTYAWNRPLDEYMPLTACHLWPSKPVLISYAMWNTRRHESTDTMASKSKLMKRSPSPRAKYQQPQQIQPSPYQGNIQPDSQGEFSLESPIGSTISKQRGLPSAGPDRSSYNRCICVSDSRLPPTRARDILNKHSIPIPTIQPPVLQHTQMPWNHHIPAFTSCTDNIPIRAVVLAMLLLFLPAKSESSCGEPILKSPANNSSTRYGCQQIFAVIPEKNRKSCRRWSIALIQRQWDNAWDLTTHQNIEKRAAGVWPTLLRSLS